MGSAKSNRCDRHILSNHVPNKKIASRHALTRQYQNLELEDSD